MMYWAELYAYITRLGTANSNCLVLSVTLYLEHNSTFLSLNPLSSYLS